MRRRLAAAALAALAWGAPVALAQPPDRGAQILKEIGFDQRLGEAVPLDAPFRDEQGRSVRLGDYFGRRPVVLVLVYYDCPMLCTLTLNGLVGAMKAVSFAAGREYEVVTVSFDPRETPALATAKKKAYLQRYGRAGAAEWWHFLTGDAEPIARLTRAVGFRYVWDDETKQYAHAAGVLVLTPDGHIARYLYGIEYSPKDLRLGVVEASAGRIGSPVDQILLYCYHYEPSSGRYGVYVMGLVRLGAILTIGLLGGFMAVSWHRERAARVER